MSKPVTRSALASAWPGSGLPKTTQSRIAHGAKTRPATTATTPISRTRVRAVEAAEPQRRSPRRGRARPPRCGSAPASPMRTPEADDPRVGQPGAARVARRSGSSAGRRRGRGPRTASSSRAGRVEQERQVDRGRQPGPDRQRPGAADGQAAFRRDVGREPPGEDRHERADDDRRPPGPPRTSCPRSAIGIAARKVGSGSQTSNAGRGNTSGGVP